MYLKDISKLYIFKTLDYNAFLEISFFVNTGVIIVVIIITNAI